MPRKKRIDRQQVLDVAITLADAQGFEAVTLASVAAQLGIRIPSLYNHVSGLPGLRHEMTVWGLQELARQLQRAAIGKAGDDAIISVAQAYRQFAHTHSGIYSATLKATTPDESDLAAAAQDVLDVVIAVLAHYQLSETDTLHVIRGLRSLLHGFVDLEIAGGFGLALDRDESFRRLVVLFLRGLHTLQSQQQEPISE